MFQTFDPQFIENLAKQLSGSIPPGIVSISADLQQKFRDILTATLSQHGFVTREEFDVQTKVLLKTREKLAAITKQVQELEQALKLTAKE